MIGLVVSGLSKAVGGYFEHKSKESVAKSNLKIAEIDAKVAVQKKVAEGKVEWETAMAKASDDSWKDEAWTILFIVIIAMCFIPFTQPYVEDGFAALSRTPDWFQWAMYASIGASFGIRGIKGIRK